MRKNDDLGKMQMWNVCVEFFFFGCWSSSLQSFKVISTLYQKLWRLTHQVLACLESCFSWCIQVLYFRALFNECVSCTVIKFRMDIRFFTLKVWLVSTYKDECSKFSLMIDYQTKFQGIFGTLLEINQFFPSWLDFFHQ